MTFRCFLSNKMEKENSFHIYEAKVHKNPKVRKLLPCNKLGQINEKMKKTETAAMKRKQQHFHSLIVALEHPGKVLNQELVLSTKKARYYSVVNVLDIPKHMSHFELEKMVGCRHDSIIDFTGKKKRSQVKILDLIFFKRIGTITCCLIPRPFQITQIAFGISFVSVFFR